MQRSVVRALCLGLLAVAPTATYFVSPATARANLGFETGIVSGTVTRSDLTPVAFAEVQISATDGSGSAWTTTDANGSYSLEVPTGDYDITAFYPEFYVPIGTSSVTVTQGANSVADFSQKVGTLSGTLLRTNGEAFPNAQIYLSALDGGSGSIAVAADGTYSATVPTGDWSVIGRYNWFPVELTTATVTDGGTTVATLSFPSGEVTSTVSENGAPKQNVRLSVWEDWAFVGSCPVDAETSCEGFEPAIPEDPMSQDMCWGCTNEVGRRFNCDNPVSDPSEPNCHWEETFNGSAQTDEFGNVELVVPVGTFNGQVELNLEDDPMADPMNPDGEYPVWGQFVLDEFQDLVVTDQSVEVRPAIAYNTGTVGGTVTLDGAPVSYAQLEFIRVADGNGFAWTQTDAAGVYSVDLPDGSYELRASGNGLEVEGLSVTVAGGSQVFDLNETSSGGGGGGFLRGLVTRNGLPRQGVYVDVRDATPTPTACPTDTTLCEHHDGQYWPEGEPIPPEEQAQFSCWGCDDGDGRRYGCEGWEQTCHWEEPFGVSTQTAADGSWSVAAVANPYTVTYQEHFHGDMMQEPDGEFFGDFRLSTASVTLADGEDLDLGTYDYQTGFVQGTITSCGELETAAAANLSNTLGWAYAGTGADGIFSMEVPAGTYDASLDYGYAFYQWPTPVLVTAGSTSTLDHAFEGHGTVAGFVSSNGAPVANARVELREPPPQGCEMPGANCEQLDENYCMCEFEGRGFECHVHDPGMPEAQDCWWFDEGGGNAYTAADGTFNLRARQGTYTVTAYTPEVIDDPMNPDGEPGMGGGGSFAIGTLQASVFTCQTTELGAADTPIDVIPPGGSATVELTENLTIELSSIDGADAGTVSFVATNEEPIDEQPAGLIEVASLYYDFSSTVVFDEATICIPYDETTLQVPEADLAMLHYDDLLDPPAWVDVTASVDTVNDIVCGVAPHFSWYVLAQVESSDGDGDGVDDDVDNCAGDANADQADFDGDGEGDVCDADIDGDGVPNAFDDCAATPVDGATDEDGCDSAQRLDARCPADGSYRNHGKYVSCVSGETDAQVSIGLLTGAEADAIVSEAARSNVGKKNGK